MQRRTFLKMASAAGVAGPALALSPQAHAMTTADPLRPGHARQIQKAVKFGMIRTDGSIREKFELLAELGYDGVEMDSPSNIDREEAKAAAEETGITIHGVVNSVHWQHTLSDADPAVRGRGLAGLETALRDAAFYGATTVLLVPAVVRKQVSYADAYRRSREEILKTVPLAEELGVTIAFENVWNHFLLSPLEAAAYVDSFESDAVGWYFDVGNIVNYGWPEHWIAALGQRIVKLDIKEYSRQKRDDEGLWRGFQVELLEGDCDWPAVMTALDEIGYTGWATAEVGGGGPERLRDIAERMDRIIAS